MKVMKLKMNYIKLKDMKIKLIEMIFLRIEQSNM